MKKFIKPFFRFILLFFLVSTTTNSFSQNAQVAPVSPPNTGFYINGKLTADSANVGDWVDGAGTGQFVLQGVGNPAVWGAVNSVTTKFVRDEYDNAADLIFQGSSFGDNPNTWSWTASKATGKCDINTALFHSTTSTDQKWLILGGDRFVQTGTSYIDFQFSQGIFTRLAGGGFSSLSATGTSLAATNGRTVGDFVLSMEYTAGGAIATVHYYRWEASGNTYKFVEYPIPSPGGVPSAYGASNTLATNVPYGAFGSTSYAPFAFVEAAVNIDAILNGACQSVAIKSIFVSTKASDSYSAALKDFVEPQQVNFVFGNAGLSYSSPSFCKDATNPAPTTPTQIAGTFAGSAGLSINSGTGVINLAATDAGTYTATYTPTGGVCLTPATTVITVKAVPTVNDPADQIVCNSASTAAITFTGAAGATFNWTNDNTSIGLAASGSGNISSFTATNSGTTTAVANFTVTPTLNGCTGSSQSFTISVKPTPTVNDPTDQTLCNGVNTNAVTFTSAVTNTTFNWTNNTASIGLAASGSGNIDAFQAVNSGTTNVVATINITPTAGGCPGSSQSFTITVKPTPTVNDPTDQTICAGATVSAVNFTGVVTGTTFAWSNNTISIGLGASGSTNISSFTGLNAGASNVTATVTVTPTANSCPGPSQQFTITVNANPSTPTASDVQPNCTTPTGTITVTSGTAGLMFSINSTVPADFTNSTGVFAGLSAGNYTIRSKNAAGCISNGVSKIINAAAAAPAAGTVSIISNPSCSSSTGTLKVVVLATGFEYSSDFEISVTGSDAWFEHDHVFNFTAGAGYDFTVRRKSDHTCTTTVVCQGEEARGVTNLSTNTGGATSRIANPVAVESAEATVKAYPNPFNDRVKFVITSPKAGYGTLDVMNMLGQKVKTVFQGQIQAGGQSFEMVLPKTSNTTLFYMLRMNGKQLTGKLIQVN